MTQPPHIERNIVRKHQLHLRRVLKYRGNRGIRFGDVRKALLIRFRYAAIEPHAGLQPLIAFDDRVRLEPGVADVQQLCPVGIGLDCPQIFVVHAQNELSPRAGRLGDEIEPFGVPAMIRVFRDTQVRLGHAAPGVGNDSEVANIGFLGF